MSLKRLSRGLTWWDRALGGAGLRASLVLLTNAILDKVLDCANLGVTELCWVKSRSCFDNPRHMATGQHTRGINQSGFFLLYSPPHFSWWGINDSRTAIRHNPNQVGNSGKNKSRLYRRLITWSLMPLKRTIRWLDAGYGEKRVPEAILAMSCRDERRKRRLTPLNCHSSGERVVCRLTNFLTKKSPETGES